MIIIKYAGCNCNNCEIKNTKCIFSKKLAKFLYTKKSTPKIKKNKKKSANSRSSQKKYTYKMATKFNEETTGLQAHGPMEVDKMEILDDDILDKLIIEKERQRLAQPFEAYYDMNADDDEAEASIEFKMKGIEEVKRCEDEEIKEICRKFWIENESSRKQDFEEEELEFSTNMVKKRYKHENARIIEMMEKDMYKSHTRIKEILSTICYRTPSITNQWQWFKTLEEVIENDELGIVLVYKTQSRVWLCRIYNDEGYRYYMKCKKNQSAENIPEVDLKVTSNGYITVDNKLINIEDTMISRMVEVMLNKKQLITSSMVRSYHNLLIEEEKEKERQ
ncbi:hypothetical protein RFI_31956 [Reticulomyxa filosa]|uniref:Uncharacterized protein n=1 Tax=Reticulomyxa filosa TaxID=46433 RepID=X6LVR6_RETFI|nr:hypothetical protein RFI_31956 [Reticulomyxa filosa]|eukprot:ETO05441.1 hypothetical protein RFI_31956 [Reticulomyxa filosa]